MAENLHAYIWKLKPSPETQLKISDSIFNRHSAFHMRDIHAATKNMLIRFQSSNKHHLQRIHRPNISSAANSMMLLQYSLRGHCEAG